MTIIRAILASSKWMPVLRWVLSSGVSRKDTGASVVASGTKAASAGLSWQFGKRGANADPQILSSDEARLLHPLAPGRERTVARVPTKQCHGMTRMSVSRSRETTIKRHTASIARALTWLRHTPDCGAVGSAFTTLSPIRIAAGPRRSRVHARTIAGSFKEIR